MIQWYWRQFNKLTADELYAILALRQDVFILEQQSIYRDLDNWDQHALHLMGMQDKQLATYIRLLPRGTIYPDSCNLGRVVTASFARKQGLMKEAMTMAMAYLKKMDKNLSIRLTAQCYLVKFYESFGFYTEGEAYDDGGIPHIAMCFHNPVGSGNQ